MQELTYEWLFHTQGLTWPYACLT